MGTPSIAQVEMAPQLAADERLDADAGNELLRQLAANWHDQGYNARCQGQPLSAMLDRSMRAGWREADSEIRAIRAIQAEADGRLATSEGFSWDMPGNAGVIAAVRSVQEARRGR